MPNENNSSIVSDQIRDLTNRVHFAGRLAELEIAEGKTKKDVPYIRLTGAIQCSDDPADTYYFRSFAQAKKADGSDSKQYESIRNWAKEAVPMTKDKEGCTWVDASGSVYCQDYVNAQHQLQQNFEYRMSFFGPFKDYAKGIDLEGYIAGIRPEIKPGSDGEETGRAILRLISKERFGNNIIDFNNIIVPQEYADQLEDMGYVRGATATFFMNLVTTVEESKKKAGGFGEQRTTGATRKVEIVITGGNAAIDADEENALDGNTIKLAMAERKAHLDEIEAAGYQGGQKNKASGASESARTGFGTPSTAGKAPAVDDEGDFPF